MTRTNYRLIWLCVIVGACFCLWFIAANALMSQAYYRVNAYTVIPPVVCPRDPVETKITRTLIVPKYLEPGSYLLLTEWMNVETGQDERLPASEGTLADNKPGKVEAISPILRMAPAMPGKWRLRVTMQLRGKVLGWPREWPVNYESDDLLTVLPPSSKECRKR